MLNTLVSKTMLVVAFAVLLCACGQGPNTGRGFQLPEGDISSGQQSFVELGCHQCHIVTGLELPAYGVASPLTVEIGGEVIRVKTYGELLTSIVNPQHVIAQQYLNLLDVEDRKGAESLMPSFNKTMTVDQLINIVTFLNSHYEKVNPEYIGYYF
jgi:sulfur-oxidizing protein SoxX